MELILNRNSGAIVPLDFLQLQKESSSLLDRANQRLVISEDGSWKAEIKEGHDWQHIQQPDPRYQQLIDDAKQAYIAHMKLTYCRYSDFDDIYFTDALQISDHIKTVYDRAVQVETMQKSGRKVFSPIKYINSLPAHTAYLIAVITLIVFFSILLAEELVILQGFLFSAMALPRLIKGLRQIDRLKQMDGEEKKKAQKKILFNTIVAVATIAAGVLLTIVGVTALYTGLSLAYVSVAAKILFWGLYGILPFADMKDGKLIYDRAQKYWLSLQIRLKDVKEENKEQIILQWLKEKLRPDIKKILTKPSVTAKTGKEKQDEIARLIEKKIQRKAHYFENFVSSTVLKTILLNIHKKDEELLQDLKKTEIDLKIVESNIEVQKKYALTYIAGAILFLLGYILNIPDMFNLKWRTIDMMSDNVWTASSVMYFVSVYYKFFKHRYLNQDNEKNLLRKITVAPIQALKSGDFLKSTCMKINNIRQ